MAWDKVSFVLKSEKRKELLFLLRKPKTPAQLAKMLSSSLPNVSLKLSDLTSKELIECVNPKETKGRIYRVTEDGVDVIKAIEEMEK